MSKKLWSISTTVRNPDRLRNFLLTLKEIENIEWNEDSQKEFQIRLIKNRFYGFGSNQFYSGLTNEQIDLIENISKPISIEKAKEIFETKNYKDPAMRGRISFKPLEKLGFAFIQDKKIKISTLGEYFLKEDFDLGELFFKSFIKWQYPNPIDRDFKDSNVYNIKPFIATLHLINEVNQICKQKNLKQKGISKIEFEIFVQSLLHYKDIKDYAKKIVEFRMKYEKIDDYQLKKELVNSTKMEFLKDFSNTDFNNAKDYTDNTIRYFRVTRFIYIRGNGYYIDLEPRREIEIKKLLAVDDGSAKNFTKVEYLMYIADKNQSKLPWENEEELQKIKFNLKKEITVLEKKLNYKENILNFSIEELRAYRKKLQDLEIKQKLESISQIDEVIEKLKNIRKLDIKPSIALEKYINLSLHIINDAKEIKSNSIVADDNEIIFTAPANKADIECYYESFNSICEVTMLNGRDQWYNEGQPVMRHLREFEKTSNLEENYCIFIAPKFHKDTINTFWFSVKYEYEGKKQKIVPLTISQIIEILQIIKELRQNNKKLSHKQFKKLLENIVNLKDNVLDSNEWIKSIPNVIKTFKKELL